jgi:hypothetical protein
LGFLATQSKQIPGMTSFWSIFSVKIPFDTNPAVTQLFINRIKNLKEECQKLQVTDRASVHAFDKATIFL